MVIGSATGVYFTSFAPIFVFVMIRGASVPNYNQLNEWPLQFLRTGHYSRSLGFITSRTTDGIWWSDEAGSPTRGHFLYSTSGIVDAQEGNYHGFGIALGCVKN